MGSANLCKGPAQDRRGFAGRFELAAFGTESASAAVVAGALARDLEIFKCPMTLKHEALRRLRMEERQCSSFPGCC
jgi:hypothetical protein